VGVAIAAHAAVSAVSRAKANKSNQPVTAKEQGE
jgi:hypothetical protein